MLDNTQDIAPAWVNRPYSLNADEIEAFRRDGHVTLRGVASQAEVAEQRAAVASAVAQNAPAHIAALEQRNTYEKAFLKTMNLWVTSPAARRFVLAQRYARIAAELMGVRGVRIYHDQALFKEPGGGPTPWHQDQYYWPVDTDNTVTMWMPLIDLDESMGILGFASGSHQRGYLGHLPISDESDDVFNRFVADNGFKVSADRNLQAGDATFHSGWTLHSAPGNSSTQMREVMTIIWVADGCRVTEPVNANQARDITRWMPGLSPGDRVDSVLNPRVYGDD